MKFKNVKNIKIFHTSAYPLRENTRHSNLNLIKPLSKTLMDPCGSNFMNLDIETMSNSLNVQFPVAISIAGRNFNKLFIIKPELGKVKYELLINGSDKLWLEFFNYLNTLPSNTSFFVHNLGSFDGLFLYKAISLQFKPDQVKTIIDHHNKFITISLNLENGNTITWLDSYRIFPVSLKDLCKTFKVEGKSQNYNQSFSSLDLFNNEELLILFKEYSLQDSIALYQALEKAQEVYIDKYKVDICSIFSTSSLSLKIFRLIFQDCNIPSPPPSRTGPP